MLNKTNATFVNIKEKAQIRFGVESNFLNAHFISEYFHVLITFASQSIQVNIDIRIITLIPKALLPCVCVCVCIHMHNTYKSMGVNCGITYVYTFTSWLLLSI